VKLRELANQVAGSRINSDFQVVLDDVKQVQMICRWINAGGLDNGSLGQ
jgi:hypothetical protein